MYGTVTLYSSRVTANPGPTNFSLMLEAQGQATKEEDGFDDKAGPFKRCLCHGAKYTINIINLVVVCIVCCCCF